MKPWVLGALCLGAMAAFAGEVSYGNIPALKEVAHLESGPCVDLVLNDSTLWIIGGGVLASVDVSDPSRPRMIGSLEGLGNVRQIECEGGLAYVTARDDGLYVVDISNPKKPVVLSQYDTLEKATGVAVSGGLVAVANRYHGVELVDASDPKKLSYLSTILDTKEVQSVDIQGDLLYATAWATRELMTVDISDPRRPRVIGHEKLDGYGDGVKARKDLCFVATGHHSGTFTKEHYQPGTVGVDGYGEGHGLEIFRIDPSGRPSPCARVKVPPFYEGYPDMWNVDAGDKHAVLADTYNGVFVVDIRDAGRPVVAGNARLPLREGKDEPVASAVMGNGVVFAAGYKTGLYVFEAPGVSAVGKADPPKRSVPKGSGEPYMAMEAQGFRYRPEGQIRAVALSGQGRAILAAGDGGVHVVQLTPEFKVLSVTPTEGAAMDVAVRDDRVYVGEGTKGLSVWQMDREGKLAFKERYSKPSISVQQVVVAAGAPYVLIENGQYLFEILDVRDGKPMREVLSEKGPGLFYGKWISPEIPAGRHVSVCWNMGGPVWYDLDASPPRRVTEIQNVVGNVVSGSWMMPDGGLLVLHGNGVSVLPVDFSGKLGTPQGTLADGEPLNGAPYVFGHVLFTTSGAWRMAKAVDISDPLHPRLLEKWKTEGNPYRVVVWEEKLLVPEGHGGLMIQEKGYLAEVPNGGR